MTDELQSQIRQAIQEVNTILLVTHKRPDGDAMGSLLGFGLSLQQAGKSVCMLVEDSVPSTYMHLPGVDQIQFTLPKRFDLAIFLDCADISRIGLSIGSRKPDINIDHHGTNTKFAHYNLVDNNAVATTEILANYLPVWGLPITKEVSDCLLTGIITDTIGFSTSNMTVQAFEVAAMLFNQGSNMPELYRKALRQRSFPAARLWGFGLSNMQKQGRLVWSKITNEERAAAAYPDKDDAEFANFLSSIDESDVSVLFQENNNGVIKVSWRAQPDFDVAELARVFGGGGHVAAAGAEVFGELDQVIDRVLKTTKDYLSMANNFTPLMKDKYLGT